MKKVSIILVLIIVSFKMIHAQDDPQMTQFFNNLLYFNPAGTGADDDFHASIAFRDQNIDYPDHPRYIMANAYQYFSNAKSAFGLSVLDYKFNIEHNLNFKLAYNYHIQLQYESFLSLGIAAGVLNRSIENAIVPSGQEIPAQSSMLPDINFGAEFYTKKLKLGASLTHVPALMKDDSYKMKMHYYAYAIYYQDIGDKAKLVPSILFRNSSFISNFEISLRAFLGDYVILGAAYRNDAFAVIAGLNIAKYVTVTYSYDVPLGSAKPYGGTHEISLSVKANFSGGSDNSYDRLNF